MNERIDLNAVVRAWIEKAESDHRAVRLLMASGKECPADIVCFHDRLTEYAVDSRYPGPAREISFAEAVEAAKIMDDARAAVRSVLPKEVL